VGEDFKSSTQKYSDQLRVIVLTSHVEDQLDSGNSIVAGDQIVICQALRSKLTSTISSANNLNQNILFHSINNKDIIIVHMYLIDL